MIHKHPFQCRPQPFGPQIVTVSRDSHSSDHLIVTLSLCLRHLIPEGHRKMWGSRPSHMSENTLFRGVISNPWHLDQVSVSQHFRGEKENIFLFFLKGRASRKEGSWKRGYRFHTVLKEAGDAQYSRKHGNIAQYSRKHGNIIDVRISSRCCWCWGDCDPSTYTFCTSRWRVDWNVSGIVTQTDGVAFGICYRNFEQVQQFSWW